MVAANYNGAFNFFIFDKIVVCIDDVRNLGDVMEKGALPLLCEEAAEN